MLLLLLITTAGLNYLVDPYGLFGTSRIAGFNEKKPTANTRVRVVKPYQVTRVQPHALIIGNSRPEMGLDPDHECWPVEKRPVYSLTTPGASVYMQMRQTQHALASTPANLIIVGVDFLDFLVTPENHADPYQWPPAVREFEHRLSVTTTGQDNDTYWRQSIRDYVTTVFSLDTLEDSLQTIASQGNINASNQTERGFNPARDYLDIIHSEGQAVLFRQKNDQVISTLLGKNWSIYHAGTRWSRDFEALKQLMETSKKHDAELILFINPYHAQYLESIRQTGKWSLFEQWKRELVKLADNYTNNAIWDFSGYNAYTTEAESVDKTTNVMDWFWEPAHYRKELGDLMLNRMLGNYCPKETVKPEFGSLISVANIELHLTRQRAAAQTYVANNPLVITKIQKLVSQKRGTQNTNSPANVKMDVTSHDGIQ
ncbi:MAG: hypothetical protein L3J84_05875 [Gammaproteobacteria bacterium]|nr:hypothetical protein [Gammaproteobacteria bacterium]